MNIYEINDKSKFNFCCIYLWRNLVNGKIYVGQTQNFYDRMKQYLRGSDKNRIIGQAFIKYGFDNFDISILEKDILPEKLDEREQYYMDYFNSYDLKIGYNLCKEASTTRGFHHSEETIQRLSEIKKQFFKDNPNIFSGEKSSMYGKTHTQEWKNEMSQRLIGNQRAKGARWTMPEEQKEKHRASMLGKQNCLGRKLSKETKEKIAESNRNRIISEKSKQKMSESHKGKTTRKVLCVETNVIYNSIGEAACFIKKDASSISKACRGKQKTVGGYHWKYID